MDYTFRKYYLVTFLAIYHNDLMHEIKNCAPTVKVRESEFLRPDDQRYSTILVTVSNMFGDRYDTQLNKFFDILSKRFYLAVREVTKENYGQ